MKAGTPKKVETSSPTKKVVKRVVTKAGTSSSFATGDASEQSTLRKDSDSKPEGIQPKSSQVKSEETKAESKMDAENTGCANIQANSSSEAVEKNTTVSALPGEASVSGEKPKTRKVIVKKVVKVVKRKPVSSISSASEPVDARNQVNMEGKALTGAAKQNAATSGISSDNAVMKEPNSKALLPKEPQKVVKGKDTMTETEEHNNQELGATVAKNDHSLQKVSEAVSESDLQEVKANEFESGDAIDVAAEELQLDDNNEFGEGTEDQYVGEGHASGAEITPARPVSERQKRKKLEVFVGGLDKEATEDDIRGVFKSIGNVIEVRLMMNPMTGKNKGYAFVRFETMEEAERAATDFSSIQIRGKECGVLPNQDNDTLFIGNISRDWKSSEVLQKVKEYGVSGIEELTLIGDPQNEALNRGYAFLELATHYDAVNAFQRLQRPGVMFGYDRPAKVSWAQPLNDADASTMSQVKSVFVDGLPPSWTEDKVKQTFGQFGDIERIVLARNMPHAKRKDFAFVNFVNRDSAQRCVQSFGNVELPDGDKKVKVKVSLTRPLQRGKADKWNTHRFNPYPGHGRGWAGRGEGRFSAHSWSRGTGRDYGRGGGRGIGGRGGKRLYDEDEVRMLLKAAREEEGWMSTARGRGGRFGQTSRGRGRGGFTRTDEGHYYNNRQDEIYTQQDEPIYSHDEYSVPPTSVAASRGKAPRAGPVRDDYESHHISSRSRIPQHVEHYQSPLNEYHHQYEHGSQHGSQHSSLYGRNEGAYVAGAQDYSEMGAGIKRQASIWDEDVYDSSHRGYPRPRIDYSDQADVTGHYSTHARSPAAPVTQATSIRHGRSTREGQVPSFYESGKTTTYPADSSERRELPLYSSSLYGGIGGSMSYDLHTPGYY
ncbi:hypothetical protein KP509_04G058800 [Ceratopteris richardii]|uniref:RRM domain-containing protein n=2 Tax=Ceratopteris richardii TaxID=49495 RepID=A0A8T2V0S3_CERRI|nr:hypothetical protein KP509_04G058800 [Ceratopteris richardii]